MCRVVDSHNLCSKWDLIWGDNLGMSMNGPPEPISGDDGASAVRVIGAAGNGGGVDSAGGKSGESAHEIKIIKSW